MPEAEQDDVLRQFAGMCRLVYNRTLEQRGAPKIDCFQSSAA
ncbi:helix-turn-helix domain-containing protein [Methylobacterium radiodurans]